jgi:hypothetical protein
MAQETGELKAHIKAEGESLKDNLEEIQTRVKDALDWKVWYRNNTAVALGGLAAGGLLISLLLPKSTASVQPHYGVLDDFEDGAAEPNGRTYMSPPRSNSSSRVHQVVDNTVAAVLSVAADKFQDFMSQALPGFREHYNEAQRNRMP